MTDPRGLAALADLVEGLIPDVGRAILGFTGAPGAGKTTLALALLEVLRARHGQDWAAHVPMDGFHLADAQLERLGLRDRKGAPETFDSGGYAALLTRLRAADCDIYAPGFERDLEQPLAAALHVPAQARVVLTEGNYLMIRGWEAVRAALDAVWFVDVDEPLRLSRLVARHEEFGKDPEHARDWAASVDQPNAELVVATRASADLLIINTETGWTVQTP
ncbi:pantothenate kinase [Kineosphaera limosa]|uniref:Phosphoribulokinase/uridine kinase domain-containing protein n=1 Tax=Kineosphaera limosa NBRC 100340 TaxID=1184609 RepID=K6WQR2_9MICO|nr:nucleoside/nucleotide kinase family protein [Kineosphaera limosa]NYE01949.1 pantothenate kinase [Kineosphaera limosa]GAB96176.1 hypothetical protein KILIM_032_00620 [Kineosphaera limosa NBRC 100340]